MSRCFRPGSALAAVALAGALVSGCAETELVAHAVKDSRGVAQTTARSQGNYKVGNRYQINGVWYQPKEDFEYVETGIASWYGPGFHGRSTANGERFDMNDMTAAHPTLQMPSLVEVTNLDNGRSVVLRINDRGPFARDRIIDVSRRGAQLLGFEREGTARVRVAVLSEESRQIAEAVRQRLPEPQFIDGEGRMMLATAEAPLAETPVAPVAGPPAVEAAPRTAVATADIGPAEPANLVQSTPAQADPAPRRLVPQTAAHTGPEPATYELAAYTGDAYSAAADRPVAVPGGATGLFVQAGAFSQSDNARRLGQQLADVGTVSVDPAIVRGQSLHRVRIGPLASVEEADRVLGTVMQRGVMEARIVVVD